MSCKCIKSESQRIVSVYIHNLPSIDVLNVVKATIECIGPIEVRIVSKLKTFLCSPSTLAGNCMEEGHLNQDVLKQSLELAIDIYLDRMNLCPCGDRVTQLKVQTKSCNRITVRS